MAASQAMLKPSRSGVNRPSLPWRAVNDPANQKKYTSHTASPRAKITLNPATDRWLLRIACLLRGGPSPTRQLASPSRDLILLLLFGSLAGNLRARIGRSA